MYNYTLSVTEMLQELNSVSFEQRRQNQGLAMLYKINYELVLNGKWQLLKLQGSRSSRHVNCEGFEAPPSRMNYDMWSIVLHKSREWNRVPDSLAQALLCKLLDRKWDINVIYIYDWSYSIFMNILFYYLLALWTLHYTSTYFI